jgi:hypothetical protein
MADTPLAVSAWKTTGSGSALQAQPRRKQKVVLVEVNSCDRNYGLYGSANQFQWHFPVPLKDVIRIDIVEGSLPVPFYNIDVGWNKFTFVEDDIKKTVTLVPGNYSISSLLAHLQTQINAVCASVYSVTVPNVATGQLRVTLVSGPTLRFGFLFGSGQFSDSFEIDSSLYANGNDTMGLIEVNSPAKILGFVSNDILNAVGVAHIDAPFPPDLDSMLRRIYLYLNFDATMDLTSVKRGSGRKEPSGIFYCDDASVPGSIKYLSKDVWNNSIYPGPSPISRIRSLNISLRDQFYRLLNLNGKEVTLLLEITMIE